MKELKSVTKLTDSFSKLPGVGHKSAEKMAYSVFSNTPMTGKNSISMVLISIKTIMIYGIWNAWVPFSDTQIIYSA